MQVRQIQQNILNAYEADISKHTEEQTQRVRMVWQSIPAQLARENKKFIYGAIRKGARLKISRLQYNGSLTQDSSIR